MSLRIIKGLTVTAAALVTATFAHAHADETLTCEPPAPPAPEATTRELLQPELRGLALDDLRIIPSDRRADPAVAMLVAQAPMVEGAIRAPSAVDLTTILSASIVSQTADYWIVDVMGRAERFKDDDQKPPTEGRVGLVRLVVPISQGDSVSDVGPLEPLFERSLFDMSLVLEVSITDWIAVLNEPTLGFRRLYPLGGGSIDRGVRVAGVTTSMTPTTEDGVLDRRYAYRQLSNPWYFRDKPYLPIAVARATKKPDGTMRKFYVESNIAFHIWQGKGFDRGYFSLGCMRMRTDDLTELSALVFAAPKSIAVMIYMAQRSDVYHPFPMSETYWEMLNVGTAAKPKFVLEYGQIYKTVLATTPLPRPEELIPLDFRERPVRDTNKNATAENAETGASSPTTQPTTP